MDTERRVGFALVGLQFALLAALGAMARPMALGAARGIVCASLALLGIGIGGWALMSNRPGNFNIHPSPKAGGTLVQRGPYQWIRHPMYSALILLAMAAAIATPPPLTLLGWGALAALVATLTIKAGLEERWMCAADPAYRGYMAQTARFIPRLL